VYFPSHNVRNTYYLIKLYIGLSTKNWLQGDDPPHTRNGVCDDGDDSQSGVFEVAGGGGALID